MTTNAKTRTMQNEYGMGEGTCRRCCNLQYPPDSRTTRICIAYGYREDVNCTWEEDSMACGLYNVPFLALRPARRPMVEMVAPKAKPVEDDSVEQLSIL